jgi:hypothetical protein
MERPSLPDVPSITSPVPSYRSHVSQTEQLPFWAREVAASVQNRQRLSRDSSVISARTKISTNTAREDARSIDLNIDGVYFRINRDGSRITTSDFRDTLPRYSPNLENEGGDNGRSGHGQDQTPNGGRLTIATTADHRTDISSQLLSPRSAYSSDHDSAQRLLSLSDGNTGTLADTGLSRNPSFTPGKDTLSVTKRRTVSQNDVLNTATIPRKPVNTRHVLRRRNGVRLPTLVTNLPTDQQPRSGEQTSTVTSASPHWHYPNSADPTLGNDNHSFLQAPRSPNFIGRDVPGLFPSTPRVSPSTQPPSIPDDQTTAFTRSPVRLEEGYADHYPPPPMESENDICVHYSRLIRTIDRDSRKALHERDKEMATLRERLNEQDIIYRQQLRSRDFIIDDLKSRIAHLETTTEASVEKACNAVEDLWENRWKDRDFHLRERMRRLETDLQLAVERAVAERDQVWAKGWATKYKQLIQRLENAVQVSQEDLEEFDATPPNIQN